MAIVLTNGIYYIANDSKGKVIKVTDIEKAQDFHSVEKGIAQRNHAPSKCAGYYLINTDTNEKTELNDIPITKKKKKKSASKRKKYLVRKRMAIYRKTQGHCYLCGEFVDFDSFEIEHKVPLSKGGSNRLDNLFCACHCCNTIKHDIYLRHFMKKVCQIFMYQMRIQSKNSLKWRIIHNALVKMICCSRY